MRNLLLRGALLTASIMLSACLTREEPDTSSQDQAVSCNDDESGNQVTICHIPPGHPSGANTITVGARAVAAHLAHGDYRGHCVPRICTPGASATCYDGPASTDGRGVCHRGHKTCNSNGTAWGSCNGDVTPSPEVCDGVDNDCDGTGDEGCLCVPYSTSSCYAGPPATLGVGTCHGGTRTCSATGLAYGACTGSVVPRPEVCGDGLDTDCDGTVDDGCVCTPNAATTCYSGPPATEGVGACRAGTKTCSSDGYGYGACAGEVLPAFEVCGDGLDNNCNDLIDEGCVCTPGSTAFCYSGPPGTEGVGTCLEGVRTCAADGYSFGACTGEIVPHTDLCGDGLDNDCDDVIDDGCVCTPDSTAPCYDGPSGTAGVGACRAGAQTCNATGTGYGACAGAVTPSAETCGDGLDNDCDGTIDDGCVCAPGSVTSCYGGPAGTGGVGACSAGTQTCNATGTAYGACVGAVTPRDESCGDGLDNDCDGTIDDGCVCTPGATAPCYDGPSGTAGVGSCATGAMACNATGTGYGACAGAVTPSAETCGDGLDNDCDGTIDDGCVCAPGSTASCYDGPSGTAGVGSCAAGAMACNATGTGYGACAGAVTPSAETCGDGLDNDCDGTIDDGCVCAPGSSAACYDGPSGTNGTGACQAGIAVCASDGAGYGVCVGAVLPAVEVCGDNIDNDCDGLTDEGCIGDRAWNDGDGDGVQDAGETGVPGAIFLLRSSVTGALIAIATTNASGVYFFSGVPGGSYFVEVIPPPSFGLGPMDAGTNDSLDSDFDGESMATATFVFPSNGHNYTIDAGMSSSGGV